MKTTQSIRPYALTNRQKALATTANINSAVGHTAGIFGGAAVGVNVAKAMSDNDINLGLSIATGVVSALAVAAATSVATEAVSGAIRKKAGVPSLLSMLANPYSFSLTDYSSLLEEVTGESDSSVSEDEEEEAFDPLAEEAQELIGEY